MYRLNINEEIHSGVWNNFFSYVQHQTGYNSLTHREFLDNTLLEYNAYNVSATPFLDFETSEDAMAFILIWK